MKRVISLFLVIITIITTISLVALPTYAYNGSETFTVTTKANYWYPGSESVTIKQSKEKYYSNKAKTKTKERNALVCTVVCTPIKWTGKKPKTITKSFSGNSKTIELEKNTTYKVKVTWKSVICAYHYGTIKSGYAYISNCHKALWSYY